jgi:hypothetical protein
MRLKANPEDQRKMRNARQARYRARQKTLKQVDQVVDYTLGRGPRPVGPTPSSGDLATLLRNRYLAVVAEMTDDQLLNKDFAAALQVGLKAQGQLDAREKAKAKQGTAEQAFAIIAMLRGDIPLQLEDGRTLEGDYEEVGDGDDAE